MNKNKSDESKDTSSIKEEVLELRTVKDDLSLQVSELQKEVHRLKIERDIYEKEAEIIKKDQGINLQIFTDREKAVIINALRESCQLMDLHEISIWLKVAIAIK